MTSDAKRKEQAVTAESTFGTAPGDWDSGPTQFHAFDFDGSGVGQAAVENQNYHSRPAAYHPHVMGLKSGGTFSYKTWWTSTGTNAAEQGTAAQDALDTMARAAIGGVHAGDADGFTTGGSAATPDMDTIAQWAIGDWMFAVDADDGDGEFIQVKALPGAAAITPHRTLSFTPVDADTAYAVITWFPDTDALSNNADSEYKTNSFFWKGHGAEDLREYLGCKGTFQVSGLNAGEKPTLNWSWMVTDFNFETLSAPTFGATPEGQPPLVTGTGDDSYFYYGTQGTYTSTNLHAIDVAITYAWTAVPAVNGIEGVGHYFGLYTDTMVTLTLPFDDDYATDYRAGTEKCMLLQIGNTVSQAVGIHCPRLQIIEEPKDVEIGGGRRASQIKCRALENDTSHSLTGADMEKFLAGIQFLRVA